MYGTGWKGKLDAWKLLQIIFTRDEIYDKAFQLTISETAYSFITQFFAFILYELKKGVQISTNLGGHSKDNNLL